MLGYLFQPRIWIAVCVASTVNLVELNFGDPGTPQWKGNFWFIYEMLHNMFCNAFG